MTSTIEQLKTDYAAGLMTRRELMLGFGAVSAAAIAPKRLMAAPNAAPIKTVTMNHVGITCSDVDRSVAFYQRIFGMPIQAYSRGAPCLRVGDGPQFIALMKAGPAAPPSINHFCLSVRNFDPERMLKIVGDAGGKDANISLRQKADGGGGPGAPKGTPELIFLDPDNLRVQLQHVSYAGGSGVHGEIDLKPARPTTKPPIEVSMINHCTINVVDKDRSADFYIKLFGLFHQVKMPTNGAYDLGIGLDAPSQFHYCLGIGKSATGKPEINHVCLGVRNFDYERVMKTLGEMGIKSGEGVRGPMTMRLNHMVNALGGPPGGTPQIFFTDPDGNTIQIQDVGFCGEANSGKDGVCPN